MGTSVLKKYEKDIYSCTTCRDGGCGIFCPSFEMVGFESYTPRGRMRIARGLLEGRLDITEPLIRTIYSCTDCGYCATRCSNNVYDVMRALRTVLIDSGKAHPSVERIVESYRENHNPAFAPHEERFDWLPEELRAPRKADVILFAGCYASHHTPWMVKSVVKILDKAGVRWTTLGLDEWCCGEVAMQLSLPDLSNEFMIHNVNAINNAVKNLGVSRVVSQCPGCAHQLRSRPRELGLTLDAEVLHVTELYDELIKEGKLQFKESKRTYVYHDACLLGKWQGIYEVPREIIKAIPGATLVEMEPRVRDLSQCCSGIIKRWGGGAGYGVPLVQFYNDIGKGLVVKRLKSARDSGAETLVSVCGGCHRSFVGGNSERAEKEGLNILLISTLIEDLMI